MEGDTRSDAERIEELEQRLRQLESRPARSRGWLRSVLPQEATQHFRAAGREQLLGMRALVDYWIRRLDDAEAARSSAKIGREEIPIE